PRDAGSAEHAGCARPGGRRQASAMGLSLDRARRTRIGRHRVRGRPRAQGLAATFVKAPPAPRATLKIVGRLWFVPLVLAACSDPAAKPDAGIDAADDAPTAASVSITPA